MIELCCEYLSVRCIWQCVIMFCTSFRVNPHSIICLNVKELLAESRRHIWSLSDSNMIRIHNHLVRKRTLNHLAKLAKWLWRLLWARSSLTFRQTIECEFTLKLMRDMIITYSHSFYLFKVIEDWSKQSSLGSHSLKISNYSFPVMLHRQWLDVASLLLTSLFLISLVTVVHLLMNIY